MSKEKCGRGTTDYEYESSNGIGTNNSYVRTVTVAYVFFTFRHSRCDELQRPKVREQKQRGDCVFT